jgi:ERCC4-type nuclease
VIYIDNREEASGLCTLLELEGIPFEKKQLRVGDCVVSGENGYLVAERKDAVDLVQSIKDSRLNNQLINMSHQLQHSLLLVHGSINQAIVETGANPNMVYSALCGAFMRHSNSGVGGHIGLVHVESLEDVVRILKYIQVKLDDPEGLIRLPDLTLPAVTDNDFLVKMVMCIPGIGEGTARDILKTTPTLDELRTVSLEKLCEIKGVGLGTAEKVKYYLNLTYGINSMFKKEDWIE